MKKLNSCKSVVLALGGVRGMRLRLGCSRTSPYNYMAGKKFPREVSAQILAECGHDGLNPNLKLFKGLSARTLAGIAKYARAQ